MNFKQLYRCAVRAFECGENLVIEMGAKRAAVQPSKGCTLNVIDLANPGQSQILNESSFNASAYKDLRIAFGFREFLRKQGGVYGF